MKRAPIIRTPKAPQLVGRMRHPQSGRFLAKPGRFNAKGIGTPQTIPQNLTTTLKP
jgi:hypothetical protein